MTTWTNDPSRLTHANGTTATAGNTGGAAGDPLAPVTSTGGSITYLDGTWRLLSTSGAARLELAVGSVDRLSVEMLLHIGATPTGADNRMVEVMTTSGYALRFNHRTDGTLRMVNGANAMLWTTTATFGADDRVRVHIAVEPDEGLMRLNVYDDVATEPLETFTTDTANAGAGPITTVRLGRITSSGTADVRLVNLQAKDTDLAPIGPLLPTPAPDQAVVTIGGAWVPAVPHVTVSGQWVPITLA